MLLGLSAGGGRQLCLAAGSGLVDLGKQGCDFFEEFLDVDSGLGTDLFEENVVLL